MKNYVEAIQAYACLRRILAIILTAAVVALVLVIIVNLFTLSLASYRVWFEHNALLVLLVAVVALFVSWHKLMPTLRTLLQVKHKVSKATLLEQLEDNQRLFVLYLTGLLLLLFATSQNIEIFEPIMKHPARYGYLGDVILGITILGFIAKLKAPSKVNINMGAFVNDEPRDNSKLSESQLQAANYLTDILANGMPRSVALTGDWGSGKTAVYHKARNDVAMDHQEVIWVDFDPWRYASEEALVKGFYESIAKQIDSEIPGFQNALRSMAHSVNQLVSKSDSSGIFQVISETVKNNTTSGASPDSIIKGLLDREGKRLVIVLDDVERQYDAERTYRALQLVHHAKTMGRDNVQVLCIFEKATLLRAAPLHMPSSEEYLEKFSEIEINVPPPNEASLRDQLEELINNPQYTMYLPDDFDLKLSPASVRDIKSHRGIIRAFNELLLEFISTKDRTQKLEAEDDSVGAITYVNYGDRFLMGHLKLKYPIIYRDIAEHRDRYTQSKEHEDNIRAMLMDEGELKSEKRARLDYLFSEANLNNEQKETVQELLVDLFPALGEVINQSSSHVNLTTLRAERRVGHRDVLDAYFALTTSQNAYIQHEKWINELTADIEGASDTGLMTRFEKYMTRAQEDNSETDSVTLLRNELMKPKHKTYQLKAFRAWMRVTLSTTQNFDSDNRDLGRILSAVNDIAQRSQSEERLSIGRFVFKEITNYLTEPRSALLMLLFLLPQQGNGYLSDYITQKGFQQGGLYQRVLKWVDDYFAEHQINIYKDYAYKDWAFVAYQWAFSSKSSGATINSEVIGATARYKRVNEYLFAMLNKDDNVAYDFIYERFRNDDSNEWRANREGDWHVNSETVAPYMPDKLMQLAKKLARSDDLTAAQKKSVQSFTEDLSVFIKDLSSTEDLNTFIKDTSAQAPSQTD